MAEISKHREDKQPLPIKFCREKHMISFFPDSSIQTKVNLCSCLECLKGNFIGCSYESGKIIYTNCSDDECSDNSDEEIENEDLYCEETVTEENEMRAECIVDVVRPGAYVALFSPPESFEIFYLCQVMKLVLPLRLCGMIITMQLKKIQNILNATI